MDIAILLHAEVEGFDTTARAQSRIVDEVRDLFESVLKHVDGGKVVISKIAWTPDT